MSWYSKLLGNRYGNPEFIIRVRGRYSGLAEIQNNWEFSLWKDREIMGKYSSGGFAFLLFMVVGGGSWDSDVRREGGSSEVDFFCIDLYKDFF